MKTAVAAAMLLAFGLAIPQAGHAQSSDPGSSKRSSATRIVIVPTCAIAPMRLGTMPIAHGTAMRLRAPKTGSETSRAVFRESAIIDVTSL
jgi:hypothetical protein